MPTQLDRQLQSRNMFLGFAGIVTAVSAWVIWGPSDMFPKQDPSGEPETWTETQLRDFLTRQGLAPEPSASKAQLAARVRAVKKLPPPSGTSL